MRPSQQILENMVVLKILLQITALILMERRMAVISDMLALAVVLMIRKQRRLLRMAGMLPV